MTPLVWQFPPSFISISMFLFRIISVVHMFLHKIQFPHGCVETGFSSFGRMSFLTRMFLIDRGRRNATNGWLVNIFDVFVSFSSRWKFFLRIDGTMDKFGCQSQTKITCGSFFSLGLSFNSSDRSILDTSSIAWFNSWGWYPRLTKNVLIILQFLWKSSFSEHIRLILMNCPFGMFFITCLGWFDDLFKYINASVGFLVQIGVNDAIFSRNSYI